MTAPARSHAPPPGLVPDPERYLGVMRSAFRRHYEEASDVWTGEPAMRRVAAVVWAGVRPGPRAHLLDIGCGSGRDVRWLAGAAGPSATVEGVDLHPHPEWARVAADLGPRVRLTACDFLSYPTEGGYDLILDNGCFHHQHPGDAPRYLRRVAELLGPGGWYALSTFRNPDRSDLVDAYGRLHRYTGDAELAAELRRAGLATVRQHDISRRGAASSYRLSFCRRQP